MEKEGKSMNNKLIKCRFCQSKDAEDYMPIYHDNEPIRVKYWMCLPCYNTLAGTEDENGIERGLYNE